MKVIVTASELLKITKTPAGLIVLFIVLIILAILFGIIISVGSPSEIRIIFGSLE